MKVKELERTVNVAWSPASHHPTLLAAGTAAQQLDASFNTSAALEIFGLNLTEPGLDLELKGSVPASQRFHRISWGGTGPGVIVGGCDNGVIQMYDVSKILAKEDCLMASQERHSGPVRALDFNPFQTNLLASGAAESEIFIWDLNNTSTPMSPGSKPQPFEDVVCLAWNKQVQHILASTFTTRCVVWDLRKNEPIIKLSDSTSRVRWKVLAWHPDVATQLCLASEEDSNPVVQLWDLRFATSPLKSLQGHSRGVLSLAWCNQDPDLLISSAKDNRILCWNPNTNEAGGEIVSEIVNSQQWIFEVSWCPRNPSLIASCSSDSHCSIYSLIGSHNVVQTSNKIADSFPGMEVYSGAEPPLPSSAPSGTELLKAPKWLKRPVGASFGFGGKLVSFSREGVKMCEVNTDSVIVDKAYRLQSLLSEGRYMEVCQGKSDQVWTFLEASLSPQPREAIKQLLGYPTPLKSSGSNVDNVTNQMANLGTGQPSQFQGDGFMNDNMNMFGMNNMSNGDSTFDQISAQQNSLDNSPQRKVHNVAPFHISTGQDVSGKICRSLLVGNLEEAVDVCISEGRMADAIMLSLAGGSDLLAKTQNKYLQESKGYLSYLIGAVVTDDWKTIVDNCELDSWKEALSAILTFSKDEELPQLCADLGARLEGKGEYDAAAEVCYIASRNLSSIIRKRTKEAHSLDVNTLQDLVELVLVSHYAISCRDGVTPLEPELSSLLAHYSQILTAEGAAQLALSYLADVQSDDALDLKERLEYNIGLKRQYVQPEPVHPAVGRKPSGGYEHQPRTYKTSLSNSFAPPTQTQPLNSNFGGQQAQPPLPVATGFPGQPPMAVCPPRPPSQASAHHPPPPVAAQPPTRSTPSPGLAAPGSTMKKYVADPSVMGGRPSYSGMYGSQPQPMYQPNLSGPGFTPGPTQNPFPPAPGPASFQSGPVPGPNPYPATANTFQPPGSVYKPPRPVTPPVASFPQPPPPTSNIFHPQNQPANQYQPPAPVNPPHLNPNVPSGWNDPPAITKPPRHQASEVALIEGMSAKHAGTRRWDRSRQAARPDHKPKVEASDQAPITHPIYGTAPTGQVPGMPPAGGTYPPPGGYQSQPYAPPQQGFNLNGAGQAPPAYQPAAQPSPQRTAAPPAEAPRPPKGPLPQQYLHLQSTLEALRSQCSHTTNNPQVKRKLDDVARKLEYLYDGLRDSKFSAETLGNLDELVRVANSGDYQGALAIHTRMASGIDFSQISPFMPALKILIQTALQLNVYLH